jgi:hypothetical protein
MSNNKDGIIKGNGPVISEIAILKGYINSGALNSFYQTIFPLEKANKEKYDDLIKILKNDDTLKVENKYGLEPMLMLATHKKVRETSYLHVIELLVSCGADINARDKNGKTALDIANSSIAKGGDEDLAKALKAHNALNGKDVIDKVLKNNIQKQPTASFQKKNITNEPFSMENFNGSPKSQESSPSNNKENRGLAHSNTTPKEKKHSDKAKKTRRGEEFNLSKPPVKEQKSHAKQEKEKRLEKSKDTKGQSPRYS